MKKKKVFVPVTVACCAGSMSSTWHFEPVSRQHPALLSIAAIQPLPLITTSRPLDLHLCAILTGTRALHKKKLSYFFFLIYKTFYFLSCDSCLLRTWMADSLSLILRLVDNFFNL